MTPGEEIVAGVGAALVCFFFAYLISDIHGRRYVKREINYPFLPLNHKVFLLTLGIAGSGIIIGGAMVVHALVRIFL